MKPPPWEAELGQTLARLSSTLAPERPRIAVVGIGQVLRGDDGAGCVLAQSLQARLPADGRVSVLDGGAAPENQTGALRRSSPALVVLLDAAQFGAPAGTLRWLPWQATSGLAASTHTLPPYMLASFLTVSLKCEVYLLGIQPADTELAQPLTPAVRQALQAATATLVDLLLPYAIGEVLDASHC